VQLRVDIMFNDGRSVRRRQELVDIAESIKPKLHKAEVYPKEVIEVIKDPNAFQGCKTQTIGSIEGLQEKSFGKNESLIVDFGDHQVGYLNLSIKPTGSLPDAPLRLKLIFGEMPCEIAESFDDYNGWISRSWLQDEIINIDVLPTEIQLPRRYAFRYLKIVVVDTSERYKVIFSDIHCSTTTSGDVSKVESLPGSVPEDLKTMDRISIKTLQDCMQSVFEDGPKRDRRLWIGDLRLQALANYYTFKNYDLVKRCLYLFGGLPMEGGQVGACVYEEPQPLIDDTYLYDYSLLFVSTLYDYYMEKKDMKTLTDLWPMAMDQIKIALQRLDERGIVKDDSSWWCFIDWNQDLNKQASAQAVLIYCLKRALYLAQVLQLEKAMSFIENKIKETSKAALTYLWNAEKSFFISGAERQISWASQIWMVLAEVLDKKENASLLDRLFVNPPEIKMVTPYMHHHLIEALLLCGKKDKALEQIRVYWGGMIKDGANCFWELYNPEDKFLSPYGSNLINSYCHAWSCTPTYFIRKYFVSK